MSNPPVTPDPTRESGERMILACALHDAGTARDLVALVDPFMVADPGLSRAWSALSRLLGAATGPADLPDALAFELADDAAPLGRADLHKLHDEVPSAANGGYYADRVRAAYARRELERIAPDELLKSGAELSTAALLAAVENSARRLGELVSGTAAAPVVVSAAEYADHPQPAPVLWRDDPAHPDSTDVDAVLSVGEVALLASAGGLGKSTLVLELASAAVAGAELGAASMAACGLAVAAGPVVLASFEDAPARIAQRLKWCNAGKVPAAVHVAPDPAPLWVAAADRGGESHPGPDWDRLWRAVREIGARLVVIDPVSVALADVSTSETSPVRAFLRAVTAEAEAARAGVLLVAHDTKAARDDARKGEDPGAGAVAGSAAWYDGARGVLALTRNGDDRLLRCVKANYGRTGWGARLVERLGPGGAFRGLELGARLDRAEIEAAKGAKQNGDPPAGQRNGAGTVDPAGIA